MTLPLLRIPSADASYPNMIILARPSVSPYLSKTLFELAQLFVDRPKAAYQSLILTSSENALAFLQDAIPHDDRVLKARLFKDKVAFRRSLAKLYPEFYFKETTVAELPRLDAATLRFPLVIKPAAGISSIGVRRVERATE